MTAHAIFSPSAASRWLRCPSSALLTIHAKEQGLVTDEPSPAAEEGTHAHAMVERALSEGLDMKDMMRFPHPELLELQLFLDWVRSQPGELQVEQRIEIVEPECFGTADVVILEGDHLTVADLKFGLTPVEAANNMQLMTYAAGIMANQAPYIRDVTLVIYQPRRSDGKDAFQRWDTTGEYVMQHYQRVSRVVDWYRDILSGKGKVHVYSGGHCTYCPVKNNLCPLWRT